MATVNTYAQDESGQWWFTFGDGRRTRAELKRCEECQRDFPTYRLRRFCSVACRSAAMELPSELRRCPQCGDEFVASEKTQRFCSHGCAAKTFHEKQTITTTDGVQIKNIDDAHYSRDERGQWWYVPIGSKRYARTRAYIKICVVCGEAFLTNIFHRKRQHACSKTCGQIAFNRRNPGMRAGVNSGRWKGGRRIEADGYVLQLAPDHPSLIGSGRRYVFEHRLVMERVLGRTLLPTEYVHHKNGIRDDNSEDNLELWAHSHPSGQRVDEQQHCPTCTCFQLHWKPS